MNLKGRKCLLGSYKSPSLADDIFEMDCTVCMDEISEKYENFILLGDLNVDKLDRCKSVKLSGICDIF